MENYIVYGLGKSGLSSIESLAIKFPNSKVIGTDDNLTVLDNNSCKILKDKFNNISFLKPTEIKYNQHSKIIFSPGIPLYYPSRHKVLEVCQKYQIKLICDIELFYQLNNQQNKFIGITGTNGKSTTTALIGFILEQLKNNVAVGGNIGTACFELPQNKNNCYVFEISSYQLDLMNQTKFDIANLTNITPDHLDRHGSMANYIEAKKRIFANQTDKDFAIINLDNSLTQNIFEEFKNNSNFKATLIATSLQSIVSNGVSIINNQLYNSINNEQICLPISSKFLYGNHNYQNIALAFASVYCYYLKNNFNNFNATEISQAIITAIENFKGLDHRLQIVREHNNIRFINDSKATNADSTINALRAFDNIFWILGGKPKDGGIDTLTPYFNKVIKAYLIGEASDQFAEFLQKNNVNFEKCNDLKNAFSKSLSDAKNNSLSQKNILLSPACASFDQWKNFEERGDFFCKLAQEVN